MGLAGVVLAAGASERMGRPKALLDFRGRPFAVRILEALEALDVKSRVVVLGPDAARIRPSLATLERLLEAYRRAGAPAVMPSFAERRGHPVIWDQALFPELVTSEAATRHGARAVLTAHEQEIVTVPVDDPAVIDDLNTPEDYERLVRELNRDIY